MSADNTVLIKQSFSIENILSKPHTNNAITNPCRLIKSIVCDSKIDDANIGGGHLVNDKVVPKVEPISDVQSEHFDDNYSMDDDGGKRHPNTFTSPDSSGCEEEIADNLSDITNEESRKIFS